MPKQEAPPLFSVNVIAGGEFFKAGKETPYKTADAVPETLKEFILDRDSQVENLDQERANLAAGEVYTVGSILTRSGAQQAVRLQQAIEFREWATDQAEASQQLAPEIEAVLQAEHDLSIGKALAQAEYHQEAVDRAYENATKEVDDRQQPMYVRHGNARHYVRAEGAKLVPGQHVFVKRPNGRYDSIGMVDANCEPPPQEIQL